AVDERRLAVGEGPVADVILDVVAGAVVARVGERQRRAFGEGVGRVRVLEAGTGAVVGESAEAQLAEDTGLDQERLRRADGRTAGLRQAHPDLLVGALHDEREVHLVVAGAGDERTVAVGPTDLQRRAGGGSRDRQVRTGARRRRV